VGLVSQISEDWRAASLQPGLRCDDFKPTLKRGIFERFSWLNSSLFRAKIGIFLEKKKRRN
jgi:hypothetical protein